MYAYDLLERKAKYHVWKTKRDKKINLDSICKSKIEVAAMMINTAMEIISKKKKNDHG